MKAFLPFLALALTVFAEENPLASADSAIARQAIASAIKKGPAVLPELRTYGKSDDPRLRVRANEAIGGITGQYGSEVDLIWKRSVKEAINPTKPLLVLHLFGNFDEEFC
ncbi:hypothetical protein [Roseibacillus persicicus]|uniref:HEAT repeat domain-containing protein n=1 Tax=Roseibacillus persicicus TaxID=454148 RepID=A0A918WQ98_9BACT|nr:hypothetical protein [Roseibacillus persicicus]GHC67255.1 hypothetical protein GCM10007100_39140 [Roseibacillus persicicus]